MTESPRVQGIVTVMAREPGLKRVLSLPVLVLYGLGTTIGAGIYALIGAPDLPIWIPILGFYVSAAFAGAEAVHLLLN